MIGHMRGIVKIEEGAIECEGCNSRCFFLTDNERKNYILYEMFFFVKKEESNTYCHRKISDKNHLMDLISKIDEYNNAVRKYRGFEYNGRFGVRAKN